MKVLRFKLISSPPHCLLFSDMDLLLWGRIVNCLYRVSRLKLISLIVSHRQRGGPYQIPSSRRCAELSPGAS